MRFTYFVILASRVIGIVPYGKLRSVQRTTNQSGPSKMLDINRMSGEFESHLRGLPSTQLVGREYSTAFESWFRVELAQCLIMSGNARAADLVFNCKYPGSGKSADIAIGQDVYFELKCFCKKADANKKQEFPRQISLLEDHVRRGNLKQGICFFTLQGYSEVTNRRMADRIRQDRFRWNWAQPFHLFRSPMVKVYFGECHSAKKIED